MLNLEFAVGHICPKYMLPFLNEQLIKQMIEKTSNEVKFALFDKKGMNRKQEIREIVKKFGLEVKEIKKVIIQQKLMLQQLPWLIIIQYFLLLDKILQQRDS